MAKRKYAKKAPKKSPASGRKPVESNPESAPSSDDSEGVDGATAHAESASATPGEPPPSGRTEPEPPPAEEVRTGSPGPVPARAATSNARDAIFDAVLLELRERGMSHRDAMSAAEDVCDRLRMTAREDDHVGDYSGATFIDLRDKQDYVYPGNKRKVKTVDRECIVPLLREPGDVNAIVIHQTACEFGVSKRAVNLHGDAEVARAHRALDVACHVLAFRGGYFVAAHDLRVHVNHGSRLNANTLGLEIEGRYPGLMDDASTVAREDLKTTWGGAPTELTDLTVKTACDALKWMVEEGHRYGMPIEYIYAHRQFSDTRRSDPGEEVWMRCVVRYAVAELGLKTKPELRLGSGAAIPPAWDPSGVGRY